MKKLKWALLLLLATRPDAMAQMPDEAGTFNPRFEVFTLPGGSLGNSVQGMVQDSTGFLWFASQGGLIRYDGQNFVNYRFDPNNPNSPSSDYIESVFLDSKGTLWLTHWQQGGLTSYDPDLGLFTRYQHEPENPESLGGDVLSATAEDTEGYIWVGGDHGLDRLDRKTGKFRRFRHDPDDPGSLSHNRVRVLYVDRQGTLWIGTGFPWDTGDQGGGLNRYDPATESFVRYLHDPADPGSLINNKVRAILEDRKGNFWVGTVGDGLHRMNRDQGTFTRLTYDPSDSTKLSRPWPVGVTPATADAATHVSSIFEDQEGRIWITAVYGGLAVFDPSTGITRKFESAAESDPLYIRFLWLTYQTRDGTLWISAAGDGQTLYKVKQGTDLFSFFHVPNPSASIQSSSHGIVKDRFGHIWRAWDHPAVLQRIDRRTGQVDLIPLGGPGKQPEQILSMMLDREGFVWIGTEQGQFRGDPATAVFSPFQPESGSVEHLTQLFSPALHSRSGHFWLGSWYAGLSRYDPATGELTNMQHDPNETNSPDGNVIWGLYEDETGNIWIGGGNPFGDLAEPMFLDRYNPQTNRFEHFMKGQRQHGMAAFIKGDKAGNIWFIDWNNGFQKLIPETGVIKRFTPFNSLLPSSNLLDIAGTEDGKLWLCDENHLIEFDPETEAMSIYGTAHGVRTARGYFGSAWVAEDGELLFSRAEGFHAFYPNKLLSEKNLSYPDLRITGFRLLGDNYAQERQGILKKPIWQTSSVRLSHDQNIFMFSIACFDFQDPSAIQLQFMLEGYDKGWRKDIRDGETPSYVNVPPGEYTFRVRGANSMGVWNMQGVSLGISILPPWWRTNWAYTLYVFCLIAGIFGVDRIQRRRVAEIERAKSRDRELAQAQEIEKAYHALKSTQTQLIQSEKMASLGELTAGIAHEIQNPLNFVNNFSEINTELIDEMRQELIGGRMDAAIALAEDIRENEIKIGHHGKRADAIVKAMLQHSRAGSGQKESTDINALADEYLRLSYHGLRAKDKSFNADFITELDPSMPKINVIPQDIGRVLLNLINNAFHAVSQKAKKGLPDYKPQVTVKTRKQDHLVEIRVKDNGDGIPDDIVNKIFQPFFTTKPTGEGTGLGLSLSYDIITKGHNGTLEVDTAAGLGSEFIVQLPV